MIQLEKRDGKAKRGRPPKNPEAKASQTATQANGEEVAAKPEPEKGPWIFKSKYREDRVTLKKPRKIKHEDGTTTVDAGVYAEFHGNTWTTDDPFLAQTLRDKIKEREERNPLHIVESTHMGP